MVVAEDKKSGKVMTCGEARQLRHGPASSPDLTRTSYSAGSRTQISGLGASTRPLKHPDWLRIMREQMKAGYNYAVPRRSIPRFERRTEAAQRAMSS